MVERVTLTDEQKKLIAKTKPLIQKLNTGVYTDNEIRQILSEITGEKIDPSNEIRLPFSVSYTHLTLPTICSV